MQFPLGGFPLSGGGYPSGAASPGGFFGHSPVPNFGAPRAPEPSPAIKGQQDVYGLLQRTLAQKTQEIARLRAEGEANARRLEQQLQEVRGALAAKTAYVKRLETSQAKPTAIPMPKQYCASSG